MWYLETSMTLKIVKLNSQNYAKMCQGFMYWNLLLKILYIYKIESNKLCTVFNGGQLENMVYLFL